MKVPIIRAMMVLMLVEVDTAVRKGDLGRKGLVVVVIVLLILQITKEFMRESIKRDHGKAKNLTLVILIV